MVIAAAFALVKVFAARPQPLTVTSAAPVDPVLASSASSAVPSAPSASGSSAPATEAVVDVAGKVRHPGLYRLPSGARIDDALRAAGGVLPGVDTTALNLAAKVTDGQQILVGVAASVPGATAAGTGAAPGQPSGPVNLNSATLDQLDALPGVGPVLAQHILDWRSEHGGFTDVSQLNDVTGIGEAKFADLKDLVTV